MEAHSFTMLFMGTGVSQSMGMSLSISSLSKWPDRGPMMAAVSGFQKELTISDFDSMLTIKAINRVVIIRTKIRFATKKYQRAIKCDVRYLKCVRMNHIIKASVKNNGLNEAERGNYRPQNQGTAAIVALVANPISKWCKGPTMNISRQPEYTG